MKHPRFAYATKRNVFMAHQLVEDRHNADKINKIFRRRGRKNTIKNYIIL